ncbi:methionine aminopeptidase [Nostocoides sp. HKS02]|uniref:methionine aminopeptidase n=1 Tax=Nostocoides sp. HKS02 TaxID=1813880 RepID=UPI0012B4FF31|nr:methionine aminopeptidase [Tetrasphaera sp. HKS02]QGN57035.1 methionine aminopeptidase [Tetrasphaera sp. HKS02]
MAYWYNLTTGTVESDENKSQSDDLMGPYGSEAEAAKALDTARQRTEAWDEEDKAWEEGSSND